MRCAFERGRARRLWAWSLFLVYSAWLLWLLMFRRLGGTAAVPLAEYAADHLVLRPGETVLPQLSLALGGDRQALANLGGNLLLFVPLGWCLPALFRPLRRFPLFFAAFAGGIAAAELAQLLLRVGVCDVDDLLLNCAGAGIGFWIWNVFCKKTPGGV